MKSEPAMRLLMESWTHGFAAHLPLCLFGLMTAGVSTMAAAAAASQANLSVSDYPSIQAALDTLPPEGGRVFIPAGTYILKGSLKPRDNTTLSGAGPATVLKACNQVVRKSAAPLAVGDRQIVMQSVEGFEAGMDVFVHGNLDWSDATEKAYSFTITAIEGNTLKFDKAAACAQPAGATVCSGAPLILVFRKKNVIIEDLTVDGNKQKWTTSVNLKMAGIYLWGTVNCTVRNCRVENCPVDGISAQFPPTGFKYVPGQPLWDTVDKHDGNGTMLVNNHVRGAGSFGIHIGGGQTKSVIRGNVVGECGSDGLYYCWDNALCVASDNVFTNNGGHGIGGLGDGNGAISDVNNVTSNNVCANNGKCGIEITGGDGNIVCGNVCCGNSRASPGAYPGIYIAYEARNTVVTGNSCYDRNEPPTQRRGLVCKALMGRSGCVVNDNLGAMPAWKTTVTFVKTDDKIHGNWEGTYGKRGYLMPGSVKDAKGVTVRLEGHIGGHWLTWKQQTDDERAPHKPGNTKERLAACWYGATEGKLDITVTMDEELRDKTFAVALYLLDWDAQHGGRAGKIEALDPADNKALDTMEMKEYTQGKYIVWNVSGPVTFRLTSATISGPVVTGVFIDEPMK